MSRPFKAHAATVLHNIFSRAAATTYFSPTLQTTASCAHVLLTVAQLHTSLTHSGICHEKRKFEFNVVRAINRDENSSCEEAITCTTSIPPPSLRQEYYLICFKLITSNANAEVLLYLLIIIARK